MLRAGEYRRWGQSCNASANLIRDQQQRDAPARANTPPSITALTPDPRPPHLLMVSIVFEDNDRHNLPHIHVRYSGTKAAIAIDDGCVLAGNVPPKQLKLVQAWIEIHKDELFADWDLAVSGEHPIPIEPLR